MHRGECAGRKGGKQGKQGRREGGTVRDTATRTKGTCRARVRLELFPGDGFWYAAIHIQRDPSNPDTLRTFPSVLFSDGGVKHLFGAATTVLSISRFPSSEGSWTSESFPYLNLLYSGYYSQDKILVEAVSNNILHSEHESGYDDLTFLGVLSNHKNSPHENMVYGTSILPTYPTPE